jgi:hypothetical protein
MVLLMSLSLSKPMELMQFSSSFCKEYKNILLGYPIIVFTDYKNNTFNGLKASDRVLHTCWLLLLEEYGVTFAYLPGNKQKNVNIVADTLSPLDIDSLKIQ